LHEHTHTQTHKQTDAGKSNTNFAQHRWGTVITETYSDNVHDKSNDWWNHWWAW